MVVLKYSKSALLIAAIATLGCILLYIWLLLDPPEPYRSRGLVTLLANSPRLAPMIVGGLLVVVWRAMSLLMGDGAALAATQSELVATNWWGTKRVPWRTITQVGIETQHHRYNKVERLVLRTVDDTVKLNLGFTEMRSGGAEALAETVDGLRLGALRAAGVAAVGPAPARAMVAATDAGDSFDADAVMARYLASKAGQNGETAVAGLSGAPVPAPQPARPGFGRKGL